MTAVATLPVLFQEGTHAARPAASAVGTGALYSCTTHSLIYQTDGSTWTTWATLGGGTPDLDAVIAVSGGQDISDALSGANAPDAGNVFATMADVGGAVSTGARYPVQDKAAANSNTNSLAVTLDSTPTNGNLLILVSSNEGANNITSITQTNVTWTKVAESTASTAPHCEIWKGVVGASPSTSITVAYSGSSFTVYGVSEWSGVTGTLDQSATATNVSNFKIPTITPTSDTALVIAGASESTFASDFSPGSPGPNLVRFGKGPFLGAAFGFPGQVPVLGCFANAHGGTTSLVTVSLT